MSRSPTEPRPVATPPEAVKTLVVEDEGDALEAMVTLAEHQGCLVFPARSIREARVHLERQDEVDLALIDLRLPDGQGVDLVPELTRRPGTEIVLVTGHGTIDSAVSALRCGATDYLQKPIEVPRLKEVMRRVRDSLEIRAALSRLRERVAEEGRLGALVGGSRAMQRIYDQILRVAPTETSVLIAGPTGTGKELVARTLHALSGRASGPFVPVNCGAIPATLVEAELFGHERGAFTGADRRRPGVFERASGGTLLLDELTEMPVEMQVKLLRVLESGTVTRLGAERPMEVDVRLLAATNRDPAQAIASGHLREDLFYRLNVFRLDLPALADRDGDVERLARSFVAAFDGREGRITGLTGAALSRLEEHEWPGNVRELRHVLERAHILADGPIGVEHLVFGAPDSRRARFVRARVGTSIERMERRLIEATLAHLGGDKRESARQLGISLKTLYNRLNAYRESEGGPPGEAGGGGAPEAA